MEFDLEFVKLSTQKGEKTNSKNIFTTNVNGLGDKAL